MKLRNWAFALAVSIFVAGAVFVEAQGTGFLSLLISESSGAVQARGLNEWGRAITIGFGTASPTSSNSGVAPQDGEVYVVTAASTSPDLRVYDANESVWNNVVYTPAANLTEGQYIVPNGVPTSGAAAGDGLAGDLDMVCYREFLGYELTITEAVFWQIDTASAAATDYIGIGIYEDADDGAQLTTGTFPFATDATVAVADVTDVTLKPDWYRFCGCQSDVSAFGWLSYAPDTGEREVMNETVSEIRFGHASSNDCTGNAVFPTTTGALVSTAESMPLFAFQSN